MPRDYSRFVTEGATTGAGSTMTLDREQQQRELRGFDPEQLQRNLINVLGVAAEACRSSNIPERQVHRAIEAAYSGGGTW